MSSLSSQGPQSYRVDSFSSFLTQLSSYEDKIKAPGSKITAEQINQFIEENKSFFEEGYKAPQLGMNNRLVKLRDRIIRIGDSDLKKALPRLESYIRRETGLEDLPIEIVGKILSSQTSLQASGRMASVSKKGQRAADRERILWMNQKKIPLRKWFLDKFQASPVKAVNFIVNSPERERITFLDFTDFDLNDEQFELVLKSCPNLQYLNIRASSSISGDALKHLVHVPQLISLNIAVCKNLEPDALKHLVHVPKLADLNMFSCPNLESDTLKYLSSVRDLTSLKIAECTQLVPHALKHLVHVPKLTFLDISFCRSLEPDSLKYLAKVQKSSFPRYI